jgi:hypothetical protein
MACSIYSVDSIKEAAKLVSVGQRPTAWRLPRSDSPETQETTRVCQACAAAGLKLGHIIVAVNGQAPYVSEHAFPGRRRVALPAVPAAEP